MKTVGKQLQEARLAKNWTPELAARETKIKVDRLHDLESDDYSHFTSATYARGFVRTYARSLGLDEYKILRQLDNKLPDDDSANIVNNEGGVAYLPETALPPRAAHRDYTGLYIVMTLGGVVTLAIIFVLFRAYQINELPRWMGSEASGDTATTNAPGTTSTGGDSASRALPIDSNTPPPIAEPAPTNAVAELAPGDTNSPSGVPLKALPVDPATLNAGDGSTPANPPPGTGTPPPSDVPANFRRAQRVDLSAPNDAPPPADIPAPSSPPAHAPLRALAVSPAELAADARGAVPPPDIAPGTPSAPSPAPPLPRPAVGNDQPLVLTASRDSFVRVTALDTASGDKPVYAAVLHSGQSIGFNGHRFSVNVDNPSAVDIRLDGVNYGPHSDHSAPETFTVVSHEQ